MKKVLFTIFLSFSAFLSAQELPATFKSALQSDNAADFKKELSAENINTCFSIKDSDYNLLALAIKTKAKACLETLISQKADLEKSCADKTPLMYAAKYGNLDAAKALIKGGAKLGARNEKGRTALDYAVKYEQKELADYFSSFLK